MPGSLLRISLQVFHNSLLYSTMYNSREYKCAVHPVVTFVQLSLSCVAIVLLGLLYPVLPECRWALVQLRLFFILHYLNTAGPSVSCVARGQLGLLLCCLSPAGPPVSCLRVQLGLLYLYCLSPHCP